MPDLTATARVVDLLLRDKGSTLEGWMSDQRSVGDSYETIAKKVYVLTSGEVDVTYQTIKRWVKDLQVTA